MKVSKPRKFEGPANDPNGPVPEQAVSYYRGSSVVLSLVGYNNTAQVADYNPQDHTNLMDTPLPSVASSQFFRCVNQTLSKSIPLVVADVGVLPYQTNAALPIATPQLGLVGLLALVLVIQRIIF